MSSIPSSILEIDFITTCPVEKCSTNPTKHKWLHVLCGGYFKLTIDGNLTCESCKKTSPLINWKFDCGNHPTESVSHNLIDNTINSLKKENDNVTAAFLSKVLPLIIEQKPTPDASLNEIDYLIAIESQLSAYSKKDRSKRINLVTPCPVNNCPNRNKYYQWTHQTCNEPLKLYRDGTVECDKCKQSRPFIKWNFKCEEHDHSKPTYLQMQDVLDVFELMGESDEKKAFIKDVKECLTEQYEEQKKEVEEQEQKMKEEQQQQQQQQQQA